MTIDQTIKRGDRYTFRWHENDGFTWRVTLTDENDQAVDIGGLTILLQARENSHDQTPAWSVLGAAVGSDSTTGQVDFDISSDQTGSIRTYLCDLLLTESGSQFTHNTFVLYIQPASQA